ncbi:vacuolar protein sorting-associated protein vps13 [Reticulomyxa filosa]|uniref:Vacuolar protein sorting-associated protein vps13 n=1 Tax=Reticulomyxa filosa TaxID=46433 RepID=X6N9J9_RETFI|nr:vacuolar protein sorting-associated protein vps13 [Reticulomyxa filosa]|eukprot:ETO22598.1 vacuolar protein sorting-associated protein vps13 [Reticulomyxa filosa]
MPFFSIRSTDIQLDVSQQESAIDGFLQMMLISNYYNPMVVTMEPLLEPTKLDVKLYLNQALHLRNRRNHNCSIDIHLQGSSTEEKEADPVNINITHIFLKTVMDTLYASPRFTTTHKFRLLTFNFSIGHINASVVLNRIITSWKPYYIVNKTGQQLKLWLSAEPSKKQTIEPSKTAPLEIPGGLKSAFDGKLLKYNRLFISFQIGDIALFENISVANTKLSFETQINTIRRRKYFHRKEKVFVVLHTLFRKGSKYVFIWSPCEIRNDTSGPLEIKIEYPKDAVRSYEARESTEFDLATLKSTKDLGIVQPGESVPVPLSIDPKQIVISFASQKTQGWDFVKLKSVDEMIEKNKTCVITSVRSNPSAFSLMSPMTTSSSSSSSLKSTDTAESFFVMPRLSRDLISIMIQTPLMVANLFPFEIVVHLKKDSFDWEQKIAAYESKHVASDFNNTNLEEISILIWIPGMGDSEFVNLPSPNSEPRPVHFINNQTQQKCLKTFAAVKSCRKVPFFRDESASALAMNVLYLYTSYLFINKTGLDIEFRQDDSSFTMRQMPIDIDIFENERKNSSKEWVRVKSFCFSLVLFIFDNANSFPFLQHDPPSESDRLARPKPRNSIDLPNDKWTWVNEWEVTDWEYAKDFGGVFHPNCLHDDHVRRRRWRRSRKSKDLRMPSTVTIFGGANDPTTNRVSVRFVDKNVQTNWSPPIPLNEAVANHLMSLAHLSEKKAFFDTVSKVCHKHHVTLAIKNNNNIYLVIKFYPRYVAINLTTYHPRLYLRPYFGEKKKRNASSRRSSLSLSTNAISPPQETTSPTSSVSSRMSEPLPYDEIDEAARILPMFSRDVSPKDEMNYGVPLHWFNNGVECFVECSIDGRKWSNPFPIHQIAQFALRLPGEEDVMRVQVRTVGQSTVVALRDERRDYPFFLIHNQTSFQVSYKEVEGVHWYKVPPRTAQPFASEYQLMSKHEKKILVKVADVEFDKPIEFEKATNYLTCVRMKGVCLLYLYLIYILYNKEEESDNSQAQIKLMINRLGISLINQVPLELIYAWADQIQCQTIWSRNEQQIELQMNSLQIDNQMPKASSDILFCGKPHNKRGNYLPWLDLKLHMYTQDMFSTYVQNFQLLPQVFHIAVDSGSIQQLVNFFDVVGTNGSTGSESSVQSQPIYFGQLYLGPLDMYISYHQLDTDFLANMNQITSTTHSNASISSYGIIEDEKDETPSTSVQNFLFQFGVLVLNIPEARIPVSGYVCQDRVLDRSMLANVLAAHYKGQFTRAFLSLLGSLEIFGNVAGLANSVQSGLHDFWYEPSSAENPDETKVNTNKNTINTQGTYSLLQSSISGVTNSLSTLTGAIGTGLSFVSADSKFARDRTIERSANRPSTFFGSLVSGGKSFTKALGSALTGLMHDPLKGAQESGTKGAILGFGQGIMGLLVKPVVGATDLVSDVLYGTGVILPSLHEKVESFYCCCYC